MSDIQTRDFSPEMSSDEICFGEDVLTCLTDVVNGKADIDHTHTEYALTTHTHDGYASQSDLTLLEDVVDTKANATHTHSEYATTNHVHSDYVSQTDFDALSEDVDGKASVSHTHSGYATADHTHTGYAALSDIESLQNAVNNKADVTHSHSDYATVIALDTLAAEVDGKANSSHTHSNYVTTATFNTFSNEVSAIASTKADTSHTHNEYATITAFDTLESEVDEKASVTHTHSEYASTSHSHDNYASSSHTHSEYSAVGHDHDEDYASINHTHSNYVTQTALDEVSATVSGKADTSHTHTGVYDANGAAASALTSANAYTDSKIDALVGEGASTTLDTIGEISSAIEDNQDAIDLLNSAIANKANVAHTHAVSDVIDLQEALDAKASNSHTHTASDVGAAASSHSHNDVYYTETEIDSLLAAKSNSSHTHDYVPTSRTINGKALSANITLSASDVGALSSDTDIPSALSDLTADSTHRLVTDAEKSAWNAKSNFSGNYNDLTNKPTIPSISGLATETYVDEAVSVKADSSHTHDTSYDALGTAEAKANIVQANLNVVSNELALHIDNDDIHFTAAERTKLSGISANANNYSHPNSGVTAGTYKSVTVNAQGHVTGGTNPTTLAGYGITDAESKGAANTALASANKYTDDAIADEVTARDSAIATAKSAAISTASSDATTKANNALASAKTYADSVGETIKNDLLGNAGTAYDTLKELGDLIDDNTDAIEALETVAAGKANASHTHTIANVTGLQSALDGKAASSHGTHVSYSTTAPVMDGTASVGTAATVARSDHKHPTDTSRAAQTSLDSHTSNKSNPHGVSLTQLGITATAAELNKLDGVTATTTELNYVDGVTSNIQTQLNGKAANSHTHSAATTSAAGLMSASDKAKLDGIASGANAYTLPTASSTLGGVKTTSTVTSASGYTACPIISGVPYYKDTNTTYSLGSFGITATAAELNYVDGVTSNIQTQLNAKAASSHTHSYAGSSSAGGAATSANKLNTNAGSATQPVYFANGIPVACTYTLGKSVPSNAKFTDTTYGVVTTSANGLMSASDKSKLDAMVLATVSEVETYLGI